MIEYHGRLLRYSDREALCTHRKADDETSIVSETSGSSETQLLDQEHEEVRSFLGDDYDEGMEYSLDI